MEQNIKALLSKQMGLCIYCFGVYGIKTYFRLRDHGIKVTCFGDVDKEKSGFVLDGIYCISYEEVLKQDKRSTIILVCKKNPDNIIGLFQKAGFLHVYSYVAVEEEFQQKYMTSDFLTDQAIERLDHFREQLYQVTCCGKSYTWEESDVPLYQELGVALLDARQRRRMRSECY